MFSYVLVVYGGYILFNFHYLSNFKNWKITYIIASYIIAILFKNYVKGAKIWWLFAQMHKNSNDCFVLEVLAGDTEQILRYIICIIESQEKEKNL